MTSKDVIVDVVEYWNEEIERSNVIKRELMDDLLRSTKMEEITVLKGVRRSGKTFMLFGLMKKIDGTYINFEDDSAYAVQQMKAWPPHPRIKVDPFYKDQYTGDMEL